MTGVLEELLTTAKIDLKVGEAYEKFAKRLEERLNNPERVPDDVFDQLSTEAQASAKLVCEAVDANRKAKKSERQPVPEIPGYAEAAAELEAAAAAQVQECEAEAAEAAEASEPAAEAEVSAPDEGESTAMVKRKKSKKTTGSKKAKKAAPVRRRKPARANAGNGRGRPSAFPPDGIITLVSADNPKQKGSKAASLWKKYVNGMTVAEARKAGIPTSDINWNEKKGFLTVG